MCVAYSTGTESKESMPPGLTYDMLNPISGYSYKQIVESQMVQVDNQVKFDL